MKYKVKLIVGFRRDQEHSIDANEAHKAYYLFDNPDTRSTFSNGLAIKGDQIQEIVPDWQGTMGWNSTHNLDSDDWNELRASGVDSKMQQILTTAKEIAKLGEPEDLSKPLNELIKTKYPLLGKKKYDSSGEMKQIGNIIKS